MNWGDRIALGGILWGLAASVGYLCYGDWKRALYFVLGSAITGVATWLL